jgi:hypothetical protein
MKIDTNNRSSSQKITTVKRGIEGIVSVSKRDFLMQLSISTEDSCGFLS